MIKLLINSLLKRNDKQFLFHYCNDYTNWISYKGLLLATNLVSIQCRFAGHSKWQNIKHTKGAKDALKSQIFNRLIPKIVKSVQKSGGNNPNINREFGKVLEMCRKANMPMATIDRAVKRGLERKLVPIKLEIVGPNGCLLVIDAETDNKGNLKYNVRGVLKKYVGFRFAEDGRAMFAFEEKGIIRVKNVDKSGNAIDLNRAEEIAIEADAEEVKPDIEDDSIFVLTTEPIFCSKCKNYIEENTDLEIVESGVELIAVNKVDLSDEVLEQVANAIEELQNVEDINKVYDNIN